MSDKARYNLRRSRTSNPDSSDQASTTEAEQEEMSEIQADPEPEPEQPPPKIARSEFVFCSFIYKTLMFPDPGQLHPKKEIVETVLFAPEL